MRCGYCNGTGKVPAFWGSAQVEKKCPYCKGTGKENNPIGLFGFEK